MTLLFPCFEDLILLPAASNMADGVCCDLNVPNSTGVFLCGFPNGVMYGSIFVSPAQKLCGQRRSFCHSAEFLASLSWPM